MQKEPARLIDQLDTSLLSGFETMEVMDGFEKKDPMDMLASFSNDHGLEFVMQNMIPLYRQGIYEETLFWAYTGCRLNWSHISPSWMYHLFSFANRDRLLKIGDPLPSDGPFRLYRGVAGVGAKRRKRGISWTASIEKAKWFAKRFSDVLGVQLEKPMVYMASVPKEYVYVYTNDREEEEFLCYIPRDLKLTKVWP